MHDAPIDVSVAVERTAEETAAEIDSIAISINMMPLVDPTFTGFFADVPPCAPSLDEKGHPMVCKLTRVLQGFPTVQPPCDEHLNYIMDDLYKERTWGSIDSGSDSDYADMPLLLQ